ncbi:hypothetical protein MRX96_030840 [Rhipicephalus microplus]
MEDSIEEDYGEGTQASSALIENTMPEPPVPTPGRGRRRTTSARGRRTTAKPYEASRQPPVREPVAARGVALAEPPTTAFVTSTAPLTVNASSRGRHGVPAKPETAGVMGLDAITTDSESVIDMRAEQYISAILPDPSTTVYATGQTSGHSANAPCSSYSAGDGCEEEPPVMSSPRRPRESVAEASRQPPVREPVAARGVALAEPPTTAFVTSTAPLTVNASSRGRHGVPAKPETAGVMGLDAITTDSESVIDMRAEQYISAILPDPSTTVYATGQTSGHSANGPCSSYSAGDGCEEEPPVMSSARRPP